ncbi:MAG: hypothetical protein A2252_01895 [Elusimicrobia bacterium RIFOXYA2_FULL_39_19]|nr:MAG: hypothetical protein A2252_01895 [Elusimicrobia bacterium RIFOXYA2_FULL_39_19]
MLKKVMVFAFVLSAGALTAAAQEGGSELKTQKDKVSYSLGWDIGQTFKKQLIEVDADILLAGLKESLTDAKCKMTDDEMKETMMALRTEIQEKRTKQASEQGANNKKEGDEYLKKNLKQKGVKATKSGLQYKVIKEGKGAKPKATDTVKVNYKGTLIDGTEFDSSYKRGEPATFPINGVIKGWTEALQLMNTGSTYELYIPSALAYGENGAGGTIGPNAVLIFTVELISIEKPESTPQMQIK